MTNILLTGGSGFIGKELMKHQLFQNALLIGRRAVNSNKFVQMPLHSCSDFKDVLTNIDVVIHAAARAHVMNDAADDNSSLYREINTGATLNLAKQAALKGVKRFIFISTIKVLGETNIENRPLTYLDPLNPQDAYSRSKAEAEVGLIRISEKYDMEVVIIRPPLVYGSNVKGNFKKLLTLCSKNIPLPLGCINNKRSLVSIKNLVDLIAICALHPKAANQTFLVSDDHDLSTSELLFLLSLAGGFNIKLFKVPPILLRLIFLCICKKSAYERLSRSMQVDITHTKKLLNWQPQQTVLEGFSECFSFTN